jgi:ABC-type Mn2+/Zn2+ transport system ATPase subunit
MTTPLTGVRDAPEILVRVNGISVTFGRRSILHDVDLAIASGEFWFLLGPNGHGKTSLLRCILGMLRPSAGAIALSPALVGRESVGFVPQRCDLNPTLPTTVREFVLLGLVGISCPRSQREQRLLWALDKVGLSSRADASYWSLSGGQRQRTLLARALVRRPRLLILDEPTNGLDLSTEEALLSFLSELNETERMTILFVTHDLAIAARHGSHFALFHDGTVTAGPAEQVLQGNHLQRTFGLPVDISRDARGVATVHLGGRRESAA